MNSPSDETTVTGNEDSDFTAVKNNNFPRQVKNEWTTIDTYNIFEVFNNPEFQDPVTNDQVPEMQCKTVPKSVTIVKGNKSKRKTRCSASKVSDYDKLEYSCDKMKDHMLQGDELNKKSNVLDIFTETKHTYQMKGRQSKNYKSNRTTPIATMKIKSNS